MLSLIALGFGIGLIAIVVCEATIAITHRKRARAREERNDDLIEILETVATIPPGELRESISKDHGRRYPTTRNGGSPLHRLYISIPVIFTSEYKNALRNAFLETRTEDGEYYIQKINPGSYEGPFRHIVMHAIILGFTKDN